MQKQIFYLGNFFFNEKKLISERFFDLLRPAFGHGLLGHPQSLEYLYYFKNTENYDKFPLTNLTMEKADVKHINER